MRHAHLTLIGERLAHIRALASQRAFAEELGVPLRTYQTFEQGQREPDLRLLDALHRRGWNTAWVLFGDGPERLETALPAAPEHAGDESQPMTSEALKIAITLAEKALDGRTLPPDDYGELVTLIYEALVNGLPDAQVLAFARPAARGLRQEEKRDETGSSVGTKDRAASR